MNNELVEFAEQVRRTCGKSLARIGMGHTDDAIEMISALCGDAEKIVHGAAMAAEVTDDSRYNLSGLHVDLKNSDNETGED